MTLALQPADWHEEALCAQVDAETWFPERGASCRDAKRICRQCPVQAQCLQYSIDHDERFGIWGGLSERERRRLRSGDVTVLTERPLWRCEACGVDLMFKGRVCSEACRHQLSLSERPPRVCAECGGHIPARSRQFKFCSIPCRQRSYDGRRSGRVITHKLTCKHCGTKFSANCKKRYCSPDCRKQGHPGYSQKPRKVVCHECGTPFMGRGPARYCTVSCRDRRQHRAKGKAVS